MNKLVRRFLVALGYAPTWFTQAEFEKRVGRPPCVRCAQDNEGKDLFLICDSDMDAWFDAVLA